MTKFWPLESLFTCRHVNAELCRFPQTVGGDRYGMWCFDCRHIVSKEKGFPGIWISPKHPDLAGIDLPSVKVAYESRVYRRCEGPCNKLALCELHHFAPRKLFDEQADEWPTGYLCKECHDLWHTKVTPGLCTTYDPASHAASLRDSLGRERFVALCRACGPLYRHLQPEAAD